MLGQVDWPNCNNDGLLGMKQQRMETGYFNTCL